MLLVYKYHICCFRRSIIHSLFPAAPVASGQRSLGHLFLLWLLLLLITGVLGGADSFSVSGQVTEASASSPLPATALSPILNSAPTEAVARGPISVSDTVTSTIYLPLVVRNSPAIYWGAYVAADIYGVKDVPPWDMQAVNIFGAHAGKQISILHWGRRWYSDGAYYNFDANLMETVRQHGMISLLDWNSSDDTSNSDQPFFSLSSIISGTHDSYIRQWATDAKNWGHPFFVRFDDEMNGGWEPWSESRSYNSPGQYAQAWRHIHDIFSQVGATNVTWVWCPNIEYSETVPLAGLYPGDAYVDWTCMDGYNWGPDLDHGGRWWAFYDIFKQTYDHILQIAPTKPVMIGETSSTELDGSKPNWITDVLLTQLPNNFPKIKAFVWMNVNADNMDWPIESSAAAQAAFAAGIASPYYLTNQFAHLDTSPIPPP